MRTVADAYGPAVEDSGGKQADIPEALTTTGDRELLVQLFANLIENALRHTPRGTRIATMRLCDDHSELRAEVSDDGPGIPEEERIRVFRRFYRLEHSRTTPDNGLGLSLVAAIVELHNATVDLLDNMPGLRFVIHFSTDKGRNGRVAARQWIDRS